MALSRQMRLLQNKWDSQNGWPKRLEWLEINGLRGWTGQRADLVFPIMAICGENGSGKSTILQAAASAYAPVADKHGLFASDFFPDTAWEQVENASIRFSVREGDRSTISSVRKPTTRWRGNPERPVRNVEYVDLTRLQPVVSRVGYQRLAKSFVQEKEATAFEPSATIRLSEIMGRRYSDAKMALTDADPNRRVPVVTLGEHVISGYHQGAGELTIAELLQIDPPQYSLVLIDEIETSLHPRSQRRLVRDLAERCRLRDLQVILTTHSPYVLAELPPEARGYIFQSGGKRIVHGVSPEFALTMMDEEPHPECDLYVEDIRAQEMLREILVAQARSDVVRCQFIRYGAASVGKALGEMVKARRFPRPSLVFVDGDQPSLPGCIRLPGDDAPERVVFESLLETGWGGLAQRTGRDHAEVADACVRAMASEHHHEWVLQAANRLVLGSDVLWTLMCQEWASESDRITFGPLVDAVKEILAYGRGQLS